LALRHAERILIYNETHFNGHASFGVEDTNAQVMTATANASGSQSILLPLNQASNPTSASLLRTDSSQLQSEKPPSVSAQNPTTSAPVLAKITSQPTITQAVTNGSSLGLHSLPEIRKKAKKSFNPFSRPAVSDGRYDNFVYEQRESALLA